jgi:hypothetical protein
MNGYCIAAPHRAGGEAQNSCDGVPLPYPLGVAVRTADARRKSITIGERASIPRLPTPLVDGDEVL